jgi:hypothetical protein
MRVAALERKRDELKLEKSLTTIEHEKFFYPYRTRVQTNDFSFPLRNPLKIFALLDIMSCIRKLNTF